MAYNAQLSAVCPELIESTKIAKLPNPHNSIHDALRSRKSKARTTEAETSDEVSEWADSWASSDELPESNKTHGG